MKSTPLRFGILCSGHVQRWQLRCLEQLRALVDVQAVVRIECAETPPPEGLFRHLAKVKEGSPAAAVELPEYVATLPRVVWSEQGQGTAAAVLSHQLDFILSFSATSAHTLSQAATHGVWSFEFGDFAHFRGPPAGFWEVYRNADVSSAMLVQLTPDPDVAIPLRRGSLLTKKFSYPQNRDQLLSRFTHWPAQVCLELLSGELQSFAAAPVRGKDSLNTAPCNKGVMRFVIRQAYYLLRQGMRGWIQHDHWNIGLIDQPIHELADPHTPRKPIRWLPTPAAGEFIADPFGIVRDGQLTIFCEHLDYRDGVGTIVALQPSTDAPRVPVSIGPSPRVHLSYPQVFEHAGRLLCIPETQDAHEVALYALERFPDRWAKLATLLPSQAVVDATIFQYEGRWWMAAASDPGGAHPGSDLSLWYAPELTGPWTPHAANPVKTDVASARPAGTVFSKDGVLYRPAQDSSATYGARVVIHRITRLTTTTFQEEVVAVVEPDPRGPYPHGLHTLSAVGNVTLVDGKKLAFARTEFMRVLRRMITKRLRKGSNRVTEAASVQQ